MNVSTFFPLAGGCSVGLDAFRFLCNVKCLCTSSVGGQGTTVFVKYGVGFIGLAINTNAETKKTTRSSDSRQSLCWVQPSEISRNYFQLLFLERTALEMFRWGCSDPARRIRYTPMTKNGTSRPEKPRNNSVLPEDGVKKRYKA